MTSLLLKLFWLAGFLSSCYFLAFSVIDAVSGPTFVPASIGIVLLLCGLSLLVDKLRESLGENMFSVRDAGRIGRYLLRLGFFPLGVLALVGDAVLFFVRGGGVYLLNGGLTILFLAAVFGSSISMRTRFPVAGIDYL